MKICTDLNLVSHGNFPAPDENYERNEQCQILTDMDEHVKYDIFAQKYHNITAWKNTDGNLQCNFIWNLDEI